MAEQPTDEQKMAAANAALAAMEPPRTSEVIAPDTVEATVAVIWSQLALLPAAAPGTEAPAGGPMFCELLVPSTPELAAEVEQYNLEGTRLAARIHAANLQGQGELP